MYSNDVLCAMVARDVLHKRYGKKEGIFNHPHEFVDIFHEYLDDKKSLTQYIESNFDLFKENK